MEILRTAGTHSKACDGHLAKAREAKDEGNLFEFKEHLIAFKNDYKAGVCDAPVESTRSGAKNPGKPIDTKGQ